MANEEILLKVEEAARRTNTSRSKFYDIVKSGEIRAIRVGGQLRIPVAELEAWLNQKLAESK
jgi:excisionase family DNA binding protein